MFFNFLLLFYKKLSPTSLKRLGLTFLVLVTIQSTPSVFSSSPTQNNIYVIPIEGEINPGLAAFVSRSVEKAVVNNASSIIFKIDTFGGQVDSAIQISNSILDLDTDISSTAFIQDKAWSAGALIALSCKKIIMKNGATIGSATPVDGSSGKLLDEKYISALRAKFKAVAEQNKFNTSLAMAMVDKDVEITLPTSDSSFSIEKGKLLNLTSTEAAELGLSSQSVANLSELLTDLGIADHQLNFVEPGFLESFAKFVTQASISSILLSIGLLLLLTEFKIPGLGFAGIAGVICLSLALGGQYIIEFAEVFELGLFLLGLIFVVLEVFVLPGFGLFGILGFLLITGSLFLSYVPENFYSSPWNLERMYGSGVMVFGSAIVALVSSVYFIEHLSQIPIFNSILNKSDIFKKESLQVTDTSSKQLPNIGDIGIALSDLRPIGNGQFNNSIFDCHSEVGYIEKNDRIQVVGNARNELIVISYKSKN
ncbi:hypothetical protein HOH45_07930 [bacterium]|jgi:membrane-bound serine protease (ClpP class)|nr:hypothetical protein [bacterium]